MDGVRVLAAVAQLALVSQAGLVAVAVAQSALT
jgi:hypothetical protein